MGDLRTTAVGGPERSSRLARATRVSRMLRRPPLARRRTADGSPVPRIQWASVSRHYRGDALVLETEFETEAGAVRLIGFTPPRNDGAPQLVWIVEGPSLSAASGSKGSPGRSLLTCPQRTTSGSPRPSPAGYCLHGRGDEIDAPAPCPLITAKTPVCPRGPTTRRPTSSASSAPCSAAGPMARSIATAARATLDGGFAPTTIIANTRPWVTSHWSPGYSSEPTLSVLTPRTAKPTSPGLRGHAGCRVR